MSLILDYISEYYNKNNLNDCILHSLPIIILMTTEKEFYCLSTYKNITFDKIMKNITKRISEILKKE